MSKKRSFFIIPIAIILVISGLLLWTTWEVLSELDRYKQQKTQQEQILQQIADYLNSKFESNQLDQLEAEYKLISQISFVHGIVICNQQQIFWQKGDQIPETAWTIPPQKLKYYPKGWIFRVFYPQSSTNLILLLQEQENKNIPPHLIIPLLITASGFIILALLFLGWSISLKNRQLIINLNENINKRQHAEELTLMATGLTHETKNPLGIIRGLAQQIISYPNIHPEIIEKAELILEESDITVSRLGEFLSYARERKTQMNWIPIEPMIQQIANLFRDEALHQNIQLSVHCDPLLLWGDSTVTKQILVNLLNNAFKATTEGEIKIKVFRDKNPNHACIQISDTGCGMNEETTQNIFKPYVSFQKNGYGLGLAIVKRLVESSGWEIEVQSILNKGSIFTISNIKINIQ